MPNWEAIYNWTPYVWWTILVIVYFIYKVRKRLIVAERRLTEMAKKQNGLLKALLAAKSEQKEVQNQSDYTPAQKPEGKKNKQLSLFDLDIEEEMSKGVKVMAKMKKDKGIIREIGLFKAGIILGLAYALFNLLREAWDKVKHHFDEEEDASKNEEDLDPHVRHPSCERPGGGLSLIVLLFRFC